MLTAARDAQPGEPAAVFHPNEEERFAFVGGDSGVEHGVHRFGPKISGQYRIAWIASKEFTTAQFAPG